MTKPFEWWFPIRYATWICHLFIIISQFVLLSDDILTLSPTATKRYYMRLLWVERKISEGFVLADTFMNATISVAPRECFVRDQTEVVMQLNSSLFKINGDFSFHMALYKCLVEIKVGLKRLWFAAMVWAVSLTARCWIKSSSASSSLHLHRIYSTYVCIQSLSKDNNWWVRISNKILYIIIFWRFSRGQLVRVNFVKQIIYIIL